MDKLAIKKYAVWARRELISRVSTKALQYGFSEEDCGDSEAESVNGHLLTAVERKQRRALIAQIREKGYTEVMEEVAYTWFNRFSALRFMEVNGYLPSHVRVFTDEENNFKPQIITEAIHLELDGLDMEKVYAFKEANQTDELYKYLLIVQCNALNAILPGMFQKIDDYTELLFPDNLLREGSVIEQMITMIPEEDWQDAVQIIGWLYQYYNAEKKDDVFAALKKNVKISKENIPAATQLFTPDWIVRYMVENSLGRLWLEGHPTNKDTLLPTAEEQAAYCDGKREPEDGKWHYYLEEAEQEPDVQAKLAEIRKEYAAMKPEDIRCIDPCCGSGHILAYLFDVLVQIYEDYGYTTREAVSSIVENNIYGLDIDDRAAQLANFAVMMKARQYDRRFFSRGIQPHVYAIVESNHIDTYLVDYFANGDNGLKKAIETIIDELHDAKEYGSILTVTQQDWNVLYERFTEIRRKINMFCDETVYELLPLVHVAQNMAQKYDVVVTNPPYMGSNSMDVNIARYISHNYLSGKTDLYAVFIEKCIKMIKQFGNVAMITQQGWMFLSSYEDLRNIILNKRIESLLQLGAKAFDEITGEVVQTCAFVLNNSYITKYNSSFKKLVTYQGEVAKSREFYNSKNSYIQSLDNVRAIPGAVFAYWSSLNILSVFEKYESLSTLLTPRQGVKTLDNNRFLKLWFEVEFEKIGFGVQSLEEANSLHRKWFPYNKGGAAIKWYGNKDYIVNWENDGAEMKDFAVQKYNSVTRTITNISNFFLSGITWSDVSTGNIAVRYAEAGSIFDSTGIMAFGNEDQLQYIIGLMNSKVMMLFLEILAPSLHFNGGAINNVPLKYEGNYQSKISKLTQNCESIAKKNWDLFEISWGFKIHPLLPNYGLDFKDSCESNESGISKCFIRLVDDRNEQFYKLKNNEEALNRIFIDIYGLQDELTPEVDDKDVTIHKADLQRDIKSLLSYAVGCMFGRYSLDIEGLVYAGGEWDASKYQKFPADEDNIIPICDDEYFEDDIVGRLIEFVKVVYGEESLEENLQFIADALGGKGSSREVIRNYFRNDFFKDHCKIYQKRPIYWLFDSGKKGGFKALIYMHRYQPDTIARMRTDYVHEQQARYRTAIEGYEQRAAAASGAERVTLNKKLKTLREQAEELHGYEEKIHHLADQMISIDLDDGVKHNYAIFQDVLAKIK